MVSDRALLSAVGNVIDVVDANPLLTFEPSPPFEDFYNRRQRRAALRAANRAGKTRHAAGKMSKECVERPGIRCRAVGPSREQVREVLGRYLAEFLAPHLAPGSYYRTGRGWNTSTIRLRNGSIIQLRSYEDRPDAHAGDSLDIIWLDEPAPQAIFTESLARVMDRDGDVWLTFTPVGRPVKWLRELIEKKGSGWDEFVVEFNRANCPWYTEEQIESWLEDMSSSPWEYAQRVEGAWEGVTLERIFTGFTDENVTAEMEIPAGLMVGLATDHGETAGSQVTVLGLYDANTGRLWVIDEYVSETSTTPEEDARGVYAMLQRRRIPVDKVDFFVGDINVIQGKGAGGFAGAKLNDLLAAELLKLSGGRSLPFHIDTPDKTPGAPAWGMKIINFALRRKHLLVHPRCKAVCQSLRHWKGTRKRGDTDLSHAADAVRYLCAGLLGRRKNYLRLRWVT